MHPHREEALLEVARFERETILRINARMASTHEGQAFRDSEESTVNEARRKAINEAVSKLEDVKSELETLRDEEQEYYDNMPESFQGGDKGDAAQSAVSTLEDAINSIDSAVTEAQNAVEA